MNTDGDYLWDKTGEPDPEVQQLEEILGTLRYQPQPLEIPKDLKTDAQRGFLSRLAPSVTPGLAIAATLVIALLALGLWLGLQRLQRGQPEEVVKTPKTSTPNTNPGAAAPNAPNEKQPEVVRSDNSDLNLPVAPDRHRESPMTLSRNTPVARSQPRNKVVKGPQPAIEELQEGMAAKDQLMLALRVASTKLNFAQRKTQSTNPKDPVHNQHKIG